MRLISVGIPSSSGRHALLMFFIGVACALPAPLGAQADTQPPTVPVSAEEIVRGDASRPWVSLVFNAGAGYTPAAVILDTLRERDVRTTFFIMGWWAERQPALVARIAEEGHEIA